MRAILIAIILVYLLIYSIEYQREIQRIEGLWEADAEFCNQAGVSSFAVYLGPPDSVGARGCYVLMANADDVLINHVCSASISTCLFLNPFASSRVYTLTFSEAPENIPRQVQIELTYKTIKMRMYNDSVLYGEFYKSGKLTSACATPQRASASE